MAGWDCSWSLQPQHHLLCLWFGCCNRLWSRGFPFPLLESILTHGYYKVHVLRQAFSPWREPSLVHHLLRFLLVSWFNLCNSTLNYSLKLVSSADEILLLQADLLSCIFMLDSWSNEECIPYKIQACDLRSELDLRVFAQRSVHCGSSLRGIYHDPQRLLLHVLRQSHEPGCSENQQGELYRWNGWVCLNSILLDFSYCSFCSFKPNRH